jgi:tetratricopeptide (TPR) repeat protein
MARDDWFRNHRWSPAIADTFFARLGKSRGPAKRAQYLRIQAVELASTREENLVRVALQLLEQHLNEFSDPYEQTQAHARAGECHTLLNEPELAIDHFRASLRANRRAPNIDCGVSVELPWLIARLRRSDLYDEALKLLPDDTGPFPVARFKASATRAVIADAWGDAPVAVRSAYAALEAASHTASGLRNHKDLGLVGSGHKEMVQWLRKRVAA